MTATQALGKGLSALIEENEVPLPSSNQANNENSINATTLPIQYLRPGPFQPREMFAQDKLNELAESIKENGMIQPIIVRSENRENVFQIIAGERRWRACKQIGLDEIPVIIRELDDRHALEFALIENIQRQNLTPIEEADGYSRLQSDFSYTQEELAKGLGKSRSHISNMLRLLTLPDDVKDYLHQGNISMGHARALVSTDNPSALAKKIVSKGLSVREAEKFASGYGGRKNSATKKARSNEKDPDILGLEQSLSSRIGLKVNIEDTDQAGKVSIHFNNLSDLDRIIQIFESVKV